MNDKIRMELHSSREMGIHTVLSPADAERLEQYCGEIDLPVEIYRREERGDCLVIFGECHPTTIRQALEEDGFEVAFAPDLVLPEATYRPPVAQLLKQGKRKKINCAKLGLTLADVPELIRLMGDQAFVVVDDDRLYYGPLHACRALSALRAAEAVGAMVAFLCRADSDDDSDDVWSIEELPKLLAVFGGMMVEPCRIYLADSENGAFSRGAAADTLLEIALNDGDLRDSCIEILTTQLWLHEEQPPILNAYLVMALVELKVPGALAAIDAAYLADRVEEPMCGSLQYVHAMLGSPLAPDDPRGDAARGEIERLNMLDLRNAQDDLFDADEDELGMMSDSPPVTVGEKIGRNDPCPCGSGKKYKKCCG